MSYIILHYKCFTTFYSASPLVFPKDSFPSFESDAFVPDFDFPIIEVVAADAAADAAADLELVPGPGPADALKLISKFTGSSADFFLTTSFPDADYASDFLLVGFAEPNSFEMVASFFFDEIPEPKSSNSNTAASDASAPIFYKSATFDARYDMTTFPFGASPSPVSCNANF